MSGEMETEGCSEMDTSAYMPDLSIVKTEYFEVEDNEPQLQYKPPYSREIIESGLVEIHTADSTTDRKPQTKDGGPAGTKQPPLEATSAAGVTSTDQHFGNIIILGVKRTKERIENTNKPAHLVKHEQRCFQTQLVLKNWRDYLDNSNTFCHDCFILFPTVNSLDYHKMTCHSHLVAIGEIKDSQVSDDSESPQMEEPATPHVDDPESLHYDDPESPPIDEPQPKRVKTNNYKQVTSIYQCKLCSNLVANKANLVRHYKTVHKVSEISKDMLNGKRGEVCVVCKASLPSQDALIEHMYQKHYNKRFDCSICSIQFTDKKELEDHLYEHAKDKFAQTQVKLKLVDPIMSNNVMQLGNKPRVPASPGVSKNKIAKPPGAIHCHFCKITFGTQGSLRRHIKCHCKKNATQKILKNTEGNDAPVAHNIIHLGGTKIRKVAPTALNIKSEFSTSSGHSCRFCKKRFPNRPALLRHMSLLHKQDLNYNCKLCGKQFSLFNNCKTHLITVHKNRDSNNIIPEVCKRANAIGMGSNIVAVDHVFQCTTCDIHYTNYLQARYHEKHQNLNIVQCKICKLKFSEDHQSIEYHYYQHNINPGKTLSVIKADNTGNSLRLVLLSKCPLCDLYLTIIGFDRHIRSHFRKKTETYFCNICNIKIYKGIKHNHIKHHKNNVKFTLLKYEIVTPEKIKQISEEVIASTGDDLTIRKPEGDAAVLLEKYNKITATWNILFVCMVCQLASDNYSQVVEHCQAHVLGKSGRLLTRQCNLCDLKLDEETFDRHYSLHISNNTIDRNSFSISQYNYSWIAKSNWITNISQSIPYENFQVLINNSIYKKIRNVILEVTRDGDPDLTVYVCHRCGLVVHENYVTAHINRLCNQKYKRKLICRSKCCALRFRHPLSRNNHDNMHKEQPSLRCRIVTFNKPSDSKSNRILMGVKGYIVDSKRQVLYKCRDCELCMSVDAMTSHLHTDYDCTTRMQEHQPCPHCDLKFTRIRIFSHLNKHKNPNFTRESIEVILFDKKETVSTGGARKHKATPTKDTDLSDEDLEQTSEEPKKKYTLFRCLACKKCIYIYKGNHSCESKDTRSCTICNYRFSGKTLQKHYRIHRNNPDYNKQNMHIVWFHGPTTQKTPPVKIKTQSVQETRPKFVIFKCKDCKLCFSMSSARRHSCHGFGQGKTCHICGLLIFHSKFNLHRLKHKSNPEYIKKNMKIVEFDKNKSFDHYKEVAKTHFDPQELFTHYQCSSCSVLYRMKQRYMVHANLCTGGATDSVRCRICKYKFSNNSYHTHLRMHKQYPNMTINIVKLKLDANVVTLPKTKMKAPLSKGSTSAEKYSLYQCYNCNMCTHSERSSKQHTQEQCGDNKLLSKCLICNLWFAKTTFRASHRKFHDSIKDGVDHSFKMIHFNPSQSEVNSDSSGVRTEEVGGNNDKLTVYQCVQCKQCVHTEASVRIHRHISKINDKYHSVKCCGLSFPRTDYYKHMKYHEDDANFSRKSFVLQSFGAESEDHQVNMLNTLYKCAACGLHYPTHRSMKSHSHMCSAGTTSPASVDCGRCHFTFSRKSLGMHRVQCLNNSSKKTDYKIVVFNDTKSLENVKDVAAESGSNENKCPVCEEEFVTKAAMNIHRELDHMDGEVDCLFCGSSFNMSILNTVHLKETKQGVRCCVCEVRVRRGEAQTHAGTHRSSSS